MKRTVSALPVPLILSLHSLGSYASFPLRVPTPAILRHHSHNLHSIIHVHDIVGDMLPVPRRGMARSELRVWGITLSRALSLPASSSPLQLPPVAPQTLRRCALIIVALISCNGLVNA
ncbi:hypothetical protein GQ44DRAFT_218229 [Phaeosphaeriaceae sp. PMI808]|nr:hypothetical protein GQ44DRAFT_218229 [Phaeosphaeriaceae sp. PMI808]